MVDIFSILDTPVLPLDQKIRVRCPCGRYAKFAGERNYYNGNFDCYSYDTDCSRCGITTIECV